MVVISHLKIREPWLKVWAKSTGRLKGSTREGFNFRSAVQPGVDKDNPRLYR
jgi:hypothetical protein